MKIKTSSLIFKIISTLVVSSVIFLASISYAMHSTFSDGYKKLTKEKISLIEQNIIPSLSLNLSFGFKDAIDELGLSAIKNKDLLLMRIKLDHLKKDIIFSKDKSSIKSYQNEGEFISSSSLIDPSTKKHLGYITIVYSKKSYEDSMNEFYRWYIPAIFIFALFMLGLSLFLYNSLKHLATLSEELSLFDPSNPKELTLKLSSSDELESIINSAKNMVSDIINFLHKTDELNKKLVSNHLHLEEAQKIAHVGSWEYNLSTKDLVASNEVYKIIELDKKKKLTFSKLQELTVKQDRDYVNRVMLHAVKHYLHFDLKYSITTLNGRTLDLHTRGRTYKDDDGSTKVTGVSMDITQEVKNKKTIEQLAYYDPLTGLANRSLLKDRMLKAIQNAKRMNTKLAIIFLDLDRFKLINDTLGHSIGDELLIYLSKLIGSQIRESDTLARLGGDEFLILLPFIKSDEDARHIASKIQKALQAKHKIAKHELFVTTSIGISLYPKHGLDADILIKNADTAMYEAKSDGRNNYKLYNDGMGDFIDKQLNLEQDLVQSIKDKDPIEMYFQPKINSTTKLISGAEALVRWNHPTKGLIFPDHFIYIAESTGLMIELGHLIIEKSILELKRWVELSYEDITPIKLAINLSARQFQDANLVSFILSIIKKYDIDPALLEFEITENLSMSDMNSTLKTLNELNSIGVGIAIDDFGTGHSSLAYLKKFPVNTLKIDRSFIMDITEDEDDRVIVQTIISMAHSLSMHIVAEGVETLKHVELLERMGCDEFQGYYFAKPMSNDDFVQYLADFTPM